MTQNNIVKFEDNTMPELRPMYLSDLNTVIKIIHAHDEDDAQAAQTEYQDDGVDDQFVLEKDEKVIGVTGYREVDATEGTYWLAWTYLDEAYQGKGLGKAMLVELLDKLRSNNARKIFVKVSDYDDPEEGRIYERALNLYESLEFKKELVNIDFYDEDESQHILGLYLNSAIGPSSDDDVVVNDEKPIIRFNGLYEIAETDGAFSFSWIVEKSKKLLEKRNFSIEDLKIGIDRVISQGGRKIFLTFPSNLPLIHRPLQASGFKYVGRLADYYEQGIHEFHFVHDLKQDENDIAQDNN